MKSITYISLLLFFPLYCLSQDLDMDGLNDQLEQNLATKFAPEWRFHKKVAGDNSNQNHTEEYYPSSIQWLYDYIVNEQGYPPSLEYVPTGKKTPISNFSELGDMFVPGTSIPANSTFWGECDNKNIRISDFPEKIPGDPHGFPTYFHCYPLGDGRVSIGYLLFYPFDYKGSYCLLSLPFVGCTKEVEPGKHKGDWEGITVVVNNVPNYSNPNSSNNAALEYVKFTGHGPKKHLEASSPSLRTLWGTHPKVYLSWGSHTSYPEPGEWHNFKVNSIWNIFDIGNVYDDFFHGNGLVVQSWHSSRQLINLGGTSNAENSTNLDMDTGIPMPGYEWITYKGLWGPDDNGGNSSPSGPPCKRAWAHEIYGSTWEEVISTESIYGEYWEDPIELDCSPELSTDYSPNPQYNCDKYVDCRVQCAGEYTSFSTLQEAVNQSQVNETIGIFPCHYQENISINTPIVLKAIEGRVIIGE